MAALIRPKIQPEYTEYAEDFSRISVSSVVKIAAFISSAIYPA
jgi:hypothetical protein